MVSPALALKITCATDNEINLCKKRHSGTVHVIGGGRGGTEGAPTPPPPTILLGVLQHPPTPQLYYWGAEHPQLKAVLCNSCHLNFQKLVNHNRNTLIEQSP